jgi:hypothetical protein
MLRISHFLDNRFTDGGKVVSLMHRPLFTPHKHYIIIFMFLVLGLERGPLSLVTTTEELLDRKAAAPV